MYSYDNPRHNLLLNAMPMAALTCLSPRLDLVAMRHGEVLANPGEKLQYIYFPTTSVVLLQRGLHDGIFPELIGIGREGMLDIATEITPAIATVQLAGHGFRVEAAFVHAVMKGSAELTRIFLCYGKVLVNQVSLATFCRRHHSVEQQLCRWMLHALDRLTDDELAIPQETIASVLGAGRDAVRQATESLQEAGYVSYLSDHIRVIYRPGLETRVCECYHSIKHEFQQLYGADH